MGEVIRPLSILVLTMIVGCERAVPPMADAGGSTVRVATSGSPSVAVAGATPTNVPDSAASTSSVVTGTRGPARTLAAYLARSTYRTAAVADDSSEWCPPPDPDAEVSEGWEPDEYIAIERPRVIDPEADTSDSATTRKVRAEVVRLVDVTRDGPRWVARAGVVTDTLTWNLYRRPSGAWGVCGPAEGPVGQLLFLVDQWFAQRGQINGATWTPAGASWMSLARIADSVRAR